MKKTFSIFIPAQLYLNKLNLTTGLKGIIIQLAWIVVLYCLIHMVWQKGVKKFEGAGI